MKFNIRLIALLFSTYLLSQENIISEHILMMNDSIELAGTLTHTKEKSPLIIWVHGSGNVDRNGNQAGANIKANYIKQFRDSINKNGIAFYSFDKRTANLKNRKYLKDLFYSNLVADVEVVVNYFKDDKRFSEIILIGHSQGSLTAMLASKNANKFISLAGPAKSVDKIIEEQTAKNSPMALDTVRAHFKELRETGNIKYVNPLLVSIFAKQNLPFLKSWMQYNPIREIKKMNVPILIINGTKDIQVAVSNAKTLHESNPKSKLLIIENMNHVLKQIDKDENNIRSYYSPDYPLSKELIKTIGNFVLTNY